MAIKPNFKSNLEFLHEKDCYIFSLIGDGKIYSTTWSEHDSIYHIADILEKLADSITGNKTVLMSANSHFKKEVKSLEEEYKSLLDDHLELLGILGKQPVGGDAAW